MGVIDSLSAGYRFLGRRFELLLIPILLDLLLWGAPQLSIAPLFERLAALYTQAATVEGVPTDFRELVEQAAVMISEIGQRSNLLEMLVSGSLLHVPSLMTFTEPLPSSETLHVTSPWIALGLTILFSLSGLFIGIIYMSLLARNLPLGETQKQVGFGLFVKIALRQWLLVIFFVLSVIALLCIGMIPIMFGVAFLALLSPAMASLVMVMISSMIIIIFFYLYFVVVGLIMDNLTLYKAVLQSFALVRTNFFATLGFVVLTNLISLGMGLIMAGMAGRPPAGTAVAIVIHAYIGSGLTMALLVFYRTRFLRIE